MKIPQQTVRITDSTRIRRQLVGVPSRGLPTGGFFALIFLALTALATLVLPGCASTSNNGKTTNIFDPTGRRLFNEDCKLCSLFNKKPDGAKSLSNTKEEDAVRSASGDSACGTSPWTNDPQPVSLAALGHEGTSWTTQRPNGAVLFPKKLEGVGPLVTMEPRSIVAQVGTEVVMVASYVGPGNQFLRTGEKLEWNIDGTGHFLTSNPSNGCLYFDATSTKKVNDHYMLATTSAKLWRIHRGTSTPTDDITILRGQSWATVQSNQEGTTSVSVLASNIDDWDHRTASGQIHWIDASFRYPGSGAAPQGQVVNLTTSVYRKTTDEPRPDWIVHYEVLSGPPAGFGPSGEKVLEVATDANGQATVPFSELSGGPGCNKIKIQIIRPAGDGLERAIVDEREIAQMWTGNPIFNIGIKGPQSGRAGVKQPYEVEITNLTTMAQDAVVRVKLPIGVNLASSVPQVSAVSGDQAIWVLKQIPPQSPQYIQFDLDVQTTGPIALDARVDQMDSSFTLPEDSRSNTTGNPDLTPPSPTVDIPSTPPQTSDPASQTPTLTPPAPTTSTTPESNVTIQASLFPTNATLGKEFQGVIRIQKTGDVQPMILSIVFPNNVYYLSEDPSTGSTTRLICDSEHPSVDFEAFEFDVDYPLRFISDQNGEKRISVRLLDEATKKVVARKEIYVNINP